MTSLRAELETERAAAAQAQVTAAIAQGLSGRALNPAAAEQVTQLLAAQIRHADVDGSGRKQAVGPGNLPVAQFVEAALKTPQYAHFLTRDERIAPGSNPVEAGTPGTAQAAYHRGEMPMAQAIISEYAMAESQKPGGGNDPRIDLSKPFGIFPASK